ncbi:small ribosomal subunit protein eS12 isoform X1 [Vitis vinifera]|uniref:small ribosomal subunit protein eS12 isoform X1 n=1 Tax=Vitis vinifera TaxID=29760 RepID=UPI002882DF14|nr:small ribosomal subunit protein eS12 isoform X1 [Vitis vinifera]
MSGDEAVVVEAAAAPPLGETLDLMTALQLVLRKSLAHGGLVRGLHEGAKVIEKHAAQLCVLAEDCNQPDYIKLVKALCADHNVSLISVPSAKTLGEWAGLCKIDSEGKARKVVGCSCVVVKVQIHAWILDNVLKAVYLMAIFTENSVSRNKILIVLAIENSY